ncbi:MAG: ribonuclease P protein component [Candidatus Caldarchaeum sp.]
MKGDEDGSFPSRFRLKRSSEFSLLFSKGKRRSGEHYTVVFLKNSLGYPRLGMVVSRKTGNAVKRSRIKRVLREAFRLNKSLFNSLDIVVMAKPGSHALGYREALKEIASLLGKSCAEDVGASSRHLADS